MKKYKNVKEDALLYATRYLFKPAPTSKQHISALCALILKNLVSLRKIFQFSAIRVL